MDRIVCLVGIVLFAACVRSEDVLPDESELTVEVCLEELPQAKAAADSDLSWEQKVKCLDLLVFSSSEGIIAKHIRTASNTPVKTTLKAGKYSVWAVANAPDIFNTVKTETDFKNIGLMLQGESGEYNSYENGMIQANRSGKGILVDVTPGKSCSLLIEVKRFVSRVVLEKIENSLPISCGELTVGNVFLSNVSLYRTIALAQNSLDLWGNRMGRGDGSEPGVIDGDSYMAVYPDLTFLKADVHLQRGEAYDAAHSFYSFQNTVTGDDCGWNSRWTPRKTRLVITASFDGMKYYYPVNIPELKRNYSYEVSLKIVGPGSLDPDIPVEKGSVELKIDGKDCSFLYNGSSSDTELL